MRKLGTTMLIMLAVWALAGCAGAPVPTCRNGLSTLAARGAYISPPLTLEQVKHREVNRTTRAGPFYMISRSGARRVPAAQLRRQQSAQVQSLLIDLHATVRPGDTIHFISTMPETGGPIAEGQDGFVVVQKGCIVRSFATMQY